LAEGGNHRWVLRKGSIANDVVGAGMTQIKAGRAVSIKAKGGQFMGQEPMVQPNRFNRRFWVGGEERAKGFGWPAVQGQGRSKALDPAPLLINKDQCRLVIDGLTQGRNQGAGLVGGDDIAGKEDETPRADIAKEGPLLIAQNRSSAAKNTGP
jgi:hypothetical protein